MAPFDRTTFDYARQHKLNYTFTVDEAFDAARPLEEYYKSNMNMPVYERCPEWAFWFARFVLNDYWPNGEELIGQNPDLKSAHNNIMRYCKTCGILGHSLNGIEEYYQPKPKLPKAGVTIGDLEAMADNISVALRKKKLT